MSAYQIIMEGNNEMFDHVGEKFKAKLMLSYINESLLKYGTISKI